ncbi:MAG: hypothetical protein SFW66_06800 [Gammaproteobacteria bacterium]|nr:hypothetical protein [Gammaproteobacteria bacterium]
MGLPRQPTQEELQKEQFQKFQQTMRRMHELHEGAIAADPGKVSDINTQRRNDLKASIDSLATYENSCLDEAIKAQQAAAIAAAPAARQAEVKAAFKAVDEAARTAHKESVEGNAAGYTPIKGLTAALERAIAAVEEDVQTKKRLAEGKEEGSPEKKVLKEAEDKLAVLKDAEQKIEEANKAHFQSLQQRAKAAEATDYFRAIEAGLQARYLKEGYGLKLPDEKAESKEEAAARAEDAWGAILADKNAVDEAVKNGRKLFDFADEKDPKKKFQVEITQGPNGTHYYRPVLSDKMTDSGRAEAYAQTFRQALRNNPGSSSLTIHVNPDPRTGEIPTKDEKDVRKIFISLCVAQEVEYKFKANKVAAEYAREFANRESRLEGEITKRIMADRVGKPNPDAPLDELEKQMLQTEMDKAYNEGLSVKLSEIKIESKLDGPLYEHLLKLRREEKEKSWLSRDGQLIKALDATIKQHEKKDIPRTICNEVEKGLVKPGVEYKQAEPPPEEKLDKPGLVRDGKVELEEQEIPELKEVDARFSELKAAQTELEAMIKKIPRADKTEERVVAERYYRAVNEFGVAINGLGDVANEHKADVAEQLNSKVQKIRGGNGKYGLLDYLTLASQNSGGLLIQDEGAREVIARAAKSLGGLGDVLEEKADEMNPQQGPAQPR